MNRKFNAYAVRMLMFGVAFYSCSTGDSEKDIIIPPPLPTYPIQTQDPTLPTESEPSQTIIQSPPPTVIIDDTMEVDKTLIEVGEAGGEISFVTTTNLSYRVTSEVDWITVTDDGRGLTATYNVTATVATNVGDAREGKILVTFDDRTATVREVKIKQKGLDILYGDGTYNDGVVSLKEPGTLSKLLGEEYNYLKSIKVIGPINYDDVKCLNIMVSTRWLREIDLHDATYVDFYTHFSFYGADLLQKIVLPHNMRKIGESAFWNCESLSSISIPNSVTEIGESAFDDCI